MRPCGSIAADSAPSSSGRGAAMQTRLVRRAVCGGQRPATRPRSGGVLGQPAAAPGLQRRTRIAVCAAAPDGDVPAAATAIEVRTISASRNSCRAVICEHPGNCIGVDVLPDGQQFCNCATTPADATAAAATKPMQPADSHDSPCCDWPRQALQGRPAVGVQPLVGGTSIPPTLNRLSGV